MIFSLCSTSFTTKCTHFIIEMLHFHIRFDDVFSSKACLRFRHQFPFDVLFVFGDGTSLHLNKCSF